mgnify:CR=1 FL=1
MLKCLNISKLNIKQTAPKVEEPVSKIVTTEEELEAFYIVRAILSETTDVENIVHRDTESYFGIIYQDNNRKPICRLKLTNKVKQLLIPDENKTFIKYNLNSLSDIYLYRKELNGVLERYKN